MTSRSSAAGPSAAIRTAQTGLSHSASLSAGHKSRLEFALLLSIFFISLWQVVDVRLIYHGGGIVREFPAFYWGWDFARDCLSRPGGPAEYLAALLAQSLYYSWFGALVLTGQAAIIFFALRTVLKALDAGPIEFLAGVPVLVLLGLYCKYAHFSGAVMSLAMASSTLLVALRLAQPDRRLYAVSLLLGPALLYFLAPCGVLLCAFALSLVCLLRDKRRVLALLPWFSSLLVTVAAGERVFGLDRREAFLTLLPVPWDLEMYSKSQLYTLAALYASFPASILIVGVRQVVGGWRSRRNSASPAAPRGRRLDSPGKKLSQRPRAATTPRPGAFFVSRLAPQVWLFRTAGLCLGAVTVVCVFRDRGLKSYLAADYYAWHRQWPQALASARPGPKDPFLCSISAQAAFHVGSLTQELPVVTGVSDLLLSNEGSRAHWRQGDLYFDLGYVNMALHHLTEAVEFWGERPILLRRLAVLHEALGNVQTARLFLNALAKVPFHSGWARQHLRQLDTGQACLLDEEVERLKRSEPKKDVVLRLTPQQELSLLLDANGTNRMAFEYLMTSFLLARDLDGFLKHVSRLKSFPGFHLPALWEDALVLAAARPGRKVALSGCAEAQRRLADVTRIVNACAGNTEQVRERLGDEYAESYFFYYFTR